MSRVDVERYCQEQVTDVREHGIKIIETWMPARAEALAAIMDRNPSPEAIAPERAVPPSRIVIALESPQPRRIRKIIERDAEGRIAGIREEVISEPEQV